MRRDLKLAIFHFFRYYLCVIPNQEMAFPRRLEQAIAQAGAPLCIGLDPTPENLPTHLGHSPEGVGLFLREIVQATADLAAAYKPNLAFFQALGSAGWDMLEKLHTLLPPHVLLIADGKFGDIPNTNEQYAKAVFDRLHAHALTVNPYLGGQSLTPFLDNPARGVFIVCVTSNPGADEIQELPTQGRLLFEEVALRARQWNRHGNVGLVVGTTRITSLERIQQLAPELPLLLPGSGIQGGSAKEAAKLLSQNQQSRALFVWARHILYASSGKDFAAAAREAALKCREEIT
ncbi:MAG: orotidine-5'-phosphate decarboxylase [Calditrichaeota bacterium]|nr:orotidine-5'-phosphate decarboxylase [Calditrichota bacterium]